MVPRAEDAAFTRSVLAVRRPIPTRQFTSTTDDDQIRDPRQPAPIRPFPRLATSVNDRPVSVTFSHPLRRPFFVTSANRATVQNSEPRHPICVTYQLTYLILGVIGDGVEEQRVHYVNR